MFGDQSQPWELHLARKAVAIDVPLCIRVVNETFGPSVANCEENL